MTDEDPGATPEAYDPDRESFEADPDGAVPLQPEQDIPGPVLHAVAKVLESLAAWERKERGQDDRFGQE